MYLLKHLTNNTQHLLLVNNQAQGQIWSLQLTHCAAWSETAHVSGDLEQWWI